MITATSLAEAERRYVERNPESRRLHEERAKVMPGGNTRTVIHTAPFPLTIVRGEGARVTDADGHTYVDFLGEFTAGLYGHSHPVILRAIEEALADGIVLGAPNRYESELAAAVCERFPSVELVRFCNSGHGGESARAVARAGRHRPAGDHGLRGRLPRRGLLLRVGGRLADQRAVPVRRRAVQRRRERRAADRGARGASSRR